MSTLARFNAVDDVFNDFFRGMPFTLRPMRETAEPVMRHIKVDVAEKDQGYVVHAEVPGAKKEDIKIEVDGAVVSITAEVKSEHQEKEGAKVLHAERYVGRSTRRFTLPAEVDSSKAEASYDHGILTLTLPKRAASTTKQLVIK